MSKQKKKETKKPSKQSKFIGYDLACGNNKQKGYIGIDFTKEGTQATIEHDLLKTPWPIADKSADALFCAHFVEHIPHGTNGFNDPFWDFFNEAWRVLKPGGLMYIITPYYTSHRAYQDPTHQRFITEMTFMYLNKEWRCDRNKLSHYPVHTDFQIEKVDHGISEEFVGRNQEAMQYLVAHEWNIVQDLLVTLKKPK